MGDLESRGDDALQAETNDQKLSEQPELDHADLAQIALGEMDLESMDLDTSQELQINGEISTDDGFPHRDGQLALGENSMDYGDPQDTAVAEDRNPKELAVDQHSDDGNAQVDDAQQDPKRSDEGGQNQYSDKAQSQALVDEQEVEDPEEYQLMQPTSSRCLPIEVHLQPPSDPESYQKLPPSWTVETVLSELQLDDNIFYEVEFDDGRIDQVSLVFISDILTLLKSCHITYHTLHPISHCVGHLPYPRLPLTWDNVIFFSVLWCRFLFFVTSLLDSSLPSLTSSLPLPPIEQLPTSDCTRYHP